MSLPVRELSYPQLVTDLEQDPPVKVLLKPGMAKVLDVFEPALEDGQASRLFPFDSDARSLNVYRLDSVNKQSCDRFWVLANLSKPLSDAEISSMDPDLNALATVCERITGQEKVGDLVYLSKSDYAAIASRIGDELAKLPRDLFEIEDRAQEIANGEAQLKKLSEELQAEKDKVLKDNPKFENSETEEDRKAAAAAFAPLQKKENQVNELQRMLEAAKGQQEELLEMIEKEDWRGVAAGLVLPYLFQPLHDPQQEAGVSPRPAFSQGERPYYGYVVTSDSIPPQFANAVTRALIVVLPLLSQPSAQLMIHESLKRLYRPGGNLENNWLEGVERQLNALQAALETLPDREAFWKQFDGYPSEKLELFQRLFLEPYANSPVKSKFLEKRQEEGDLPQIESLTKELMDSYAVYQKTLDAAEAREDREDWASYATIGSVIAVGAVVVFAPKIAALIPSIVARTVVSTAVAVVVTTGVNAIQQVWDKQVWKDENDPFSGGELVQTLGLAFATGALSSIGGRGASLLGGRMLTMIPKWRWVKTVAESGVWKEMVAPLMSTVADGTAVGAIQTPLLRAAESVIKEGKLPTVAETKSHAWEGAKTGAKFGAFFGGLGLGYKLLRARSQGPATTSPPAAGADTAAVAAAAPAAAVLANPNQLPDAIPPLKRTWGERGKAVVANGAVYLGLPSVLTQVPFIKDLPGLAEWAGLLLPLGVKQIYSRILKLPAPWEGIGLRGALARSVGLETKAPFHEIVGRLTKRGLDPSVPRPKPTKALKEVLALTDREAEGILRIKLTKTTTAGEIEVAYENAIATLKTTNRYQTDHGPTQDHLNVEAAYNWISARLASRQPAPAAAAVGGAAASASPLVDVDEKVRALLAKTEIPQGTDWSDLDGFKKIVEARASVLQQSGDLNRTNPEAQVLVELDQLLMLGIFRAP